MSAEVVCKRSQPFWMMDLYFQQQQDPGFDGVQSSYWPKLMCLRFKFLTAEAPCLYTLRVILPSAPKLPNTWLILTKGVLLSQRSGQYTYSSRVSAANFDVIEMLLAQHHPSAPVGGKTIWMGIICRSN